MLDEVKSYLQEHPIKRKEDPLHWWKVNGSRFSHPRTFGKKVFSNPCNIYTFQKLLE